MSRRRALTGVARGGDGRFRAWCRACPNRAWRRLMPDERVGAACDTEDEARAQLRRHRSSAVHLEYLNSASDTAPTEEERLLAAIFDAPDALPSPCSRCGQYHHVRMACKTAARFKKDGPT